MADETLYRQLILSPGYDTKTGVFGLVCSADNGQTFKVYWTPYGRVWYSEDAKSFFPQLWPLIEQKLKDSGLIEGAVTVTWDQVQNKPELVTEEQLTDKLKGYLPVNGSITWDHITGKPDMSSYYTKTEADSKLSDARSAASSAQTIASQAQSKANSAFSEASSAYSLASTANSTVNSVSSRINKIDTSNLYKSKEPSDYTDGSISYEVKSVSYLGINRDGIASELQSGSTAIVTTKAYNGMVRQTAEIIDSQVPATFIRNGYQSTWSNWYISQLTAM